VADWFCAPRWVQQGVLDTDPSPRTWLAFATRDVFGQTLVNGLRQGGHRVVVVYPGDTFAKVDELTYTLAAEAGGTGYQELLDALSSRDLLPERIAHGWLVTLDRAFRPGSTFFHRNQEHGFYSLFHLVRALSRAGVADKGADLVVFANGAQRVRAEALVFPDKTTALGPCAVAPREFPALTTRFVDIDFGLSADGEGTKGRKPRTSGASAPVDPAAVEVLRAELGEELSAVPATQTVAWRQGVRWQRLLGPLPTASADAEPRLRPQGVYLITGGFGGIGGVIAEWLARQTQAKLVLVGRTPLPQRGDWDEWLQQNGAQDSISRSIQQVRQLESLGASVLPVAADVAVADSMRDAVAEIRKSFGAVHGVFHAAGTIRDSLIAMKGPRDIEDVFSAKVYGTLILDEIFKDSSLDFMLLFSSTSAHVAPAGQVDYVGASAFVNAFAQSCQGQRSYPVTAIGWGIWKDVGMVGQQGSAPNTSSTASVPGEAIPITNPQFKTHHISREGTTAVHVLGGALGTNDWVIDEHRLGNGDALLPGTGYLELIRAALAELGEAGPWQLSGLVFESPMFVAEGSQSAFKVVLKRDGKQWTVDILAEDFSASGNFRRCASGKVASQISEAPASLDVQAIASRCTASVVQSVGSAALRTRQEHHLRFGPRWQVLRKLRLGHREAFARLQLNDSFAADLSTHALHPGLLDIATGCAMDLIPGYAEQEVPQHLWAPISYRGLKFWAALQPEIVSWIRLSSEGDTGSDFAAFDVTLCDAHGRILAEVEQLTLRRIDSQLQAPKVSASAAKSGEVSEGEAARAKPLSPGELALAHNVSQGITPAEGLSALARLLAMPPSAEVIISSMRISDLMSQAKALSQASQSNNDSARFSRPELDSDFVAPRDSIEKSLAELWAKLLGVEGVGIRDSFFDLGGHSLIAVRLFNEIGDKFKIDLPMSVLMQAPTIEALAAKVRGGSFVEGAEGEAGAAGGESSAGSSAAAASQATTFHHVVPMHPGPSGGRTPLFIVAGMFGNVLNLSHLAHLLGEERPFYALQARGLYGDSEPHETFEAAAADYIKELLQVQPQGPYLLGGFSGGGLIAFEMAKQLLASGEQVLSVLMLDTPAREIPRFTLGDKLSMLRQSAQREGLAVIGNRISSRMAWEREKRQRREQAAGEQASDAISFQSQRIGEAFWRALARYKLTRVPVKVALFRPKLSIKFRLSGGRLVDGERNYVREDNFWTPYAGELQVFEVPGNHDNMVLEPNVRVLVSLLRRVIDKLGKV
jgi:thioesterase domain-containing protein/NAD(P)-dependent dehydrogenase (short-subunit alcohol dehydrogenase family)/acyl carrier protein